MSEFETNIDNSDEALTDGAVRDGGQRDEKLEGAPGSIGDVEHDDKSLLTKEDKILKVAASATRFLSSRAIAELATQSIKGIKDPVRKLEAEEAMRPIHKSLAREEIELQDRRSLSFEQEIERE